MVKNTNCASCGMLSPAPAYHPFAACELFKHLRNSKRVDANIRAVVEYGMKAKEAGVSIDDAMVNISSVMSHKDAPKDYESLERERDALRINLENLLGLLKSLDHTWTEGYKQAERLLAKGADHER